jgi:hypothetical protein
VTLDVLRGGCGPLIIMLAGSYSWVGGVAYQWVFSGNRCTMWLSASVNRLQVRVL